MKYGELEMYTRPLNTRDLLSDLED